MFQEANESMTRTGYIGFDKNIPSLLSLNPRGPGEQKGEEQRPYMLARRERRQLGQSDTTWLHHQEDCPERRPRLGSTASTLTGESTAGCSPCNAQLQQLGALYPSSVQTGIPVSLGARVMSVESAEKGPKTLDARRMEPHTAMAIRTPVSV